MVSLIPSGLLVLHVPLSPLFVALFNVSLSHIVATIDAGFLSSARIYNVMLKGDFLSRAERIIWCGFWIESKHWKAVNLD
ncbi:hypothetical protein I3842_05G177400 [Carya illinoinensis]|uniref:Uncharacterized protein n=1 Tax=Carya illinoinensis TaxID=32201 RepID=A0A922JMJ6_CARIL|nr:hypothetical protein I3842_05G177400 [Carya illinoinensis]